MSSPAKKENWTSKYKDAAIAQARALNSKRKEGEPAISWLSIASEMRAKEGIVAKPKTEKSECAKKSEDDCKKDPGCMWSKGKKKKDGSLGSPYCQKKSVAPTAKGASPKKEQKVQKRQKRQQSDEEVDF